MFIVPSFAPADYLNLGKCVEFADKEYGKLHCTIADGNFVPYVTFGMRCMGQICDAAQSILSVHLLVTDPLAYAEPLARCYPETVFLHLAALPYPLEAVNRYRALGMGVGLALTPRESTDGLEYLMHKVDAILQMTNEPDGRDGEYLPELEPKIARLAATGIPLWLEGGLTQQLAPRLEELGASALVMGKAIFRRAD
mgnify:FL=1